MPEKTNLYVIKAKKPTNKDLHGFAFLKAKTKNTLM